MFLRPYTRAIPSPIDNTRPVSSSSAFGADPKILCSNIEETSAVPVTQNYLTLNHLIRFCGEHEHMTVNFPFSI